MINKFEKQNIHILDACNQDSKTAELLYKVIEKLKNDYGVTSKVVTPMMTVFEKTDCWLVRSVFLDRIKVHQAPIYVIPETRKGISSKLDFHNKFPEVKITESNATKNSRLKIALQMSDWVVKVLNNKDTTSELKEEIINISNLAIKMWQELKYSPVNNVMDFNVEHRGEKDGEAAENANLIDIASNATRFGHSYFATTTYGTLKWLIDKEDIKNDELKELSNFIQEKIFDDKILSQEEEFQKNALQTINDKIDGLSENARDILDSYRREHLFYFTELLFYDVVDNSREAIKDELNRNHEAIKQNVESKYERKFLIKTGAASEFFYVIDDVFNYFIQASLLLDDSKFKDMVRDRILSTPDKGEIAAYDFMYLYIPLGTDFEVTGLPEELRDSSPEEIYKKLLSDINFTIISDDKMPAIRNVISYEKETDQSANFNIINLPQLALIMERLGLVESWQDCFANEELMTNAQIKISQQTNNQPDNEVARHEAAERLIKHSFGVSLDC